MKKFDIVGIDSPCQDFVMNIDHLPTPNQGVRVNASSVIYSTSSAVNLARTVFKPKAA